MRKAPESTGGVMSNVSMSKCVGLRRIGLTFVLGLILVTGTINPGLIDRTFTALAFSVRPD